jgi:hypothetical protein
MKLILFHYRFLKIIDVSFSRYVAWIDRPLNRNGRSSQKMTELQTSFTISFFFEIRVSSFLFNKNSKPGLRTVIPFLLEKSTVMGCYDSLFWKIGNFRARFNYKFARHIEELV